jgi:hypothetical protein
MALTCNSFGQKALWSKTCVTSSKRSHYMLCDHCNMTLLFAVCMMLRYNLLPKKNTLFESTKMGLSGRRVKQRIPTDPRNLGWANGAFTLPFGNITLSIDSANKDATKFGQNYLTKLGWDPTKGLGVNGEGRTSHVKVSQKLDMLGIGGAQQCGPNGIAWKQNQDFESVLKRLNEKQREPEIEPAEVGTDEKPEDAGDKRKRKRKRSKERERNSGRERRKQANDESAQKPVVPHIKAYVNFASLSAHHIQHRSILLAIVHESSRPREWLQNPPLPSLRFSESHQHLLQPKCQQTMKLRWRI